MALEPLTPPPRVGYVPGMLSIAFVIAAAAAPPPDLELVGVVLSRDRPVAILRSGERTRSVSIGERAFGARLVAVAPGNATVEYADRTVELPLSTRPPDRSAAGPPVAANAAAGAAQDDVRDATRSVKTMRRADVEKRLAGEIPRILAETSVIPVRRDGRVVGLTLSRIPSDSLLLEAGLSAGDVLTRINGTDIDGMGALIGLWPRLQFASELTADVLRNGEPFTVQVNLR
jgi:type II secretion system protein C